MKIVCIGGGPAGLYFALLAKQNNPTHEITVVERNKPYDTFGWGVVFSDETLGNMRDCDTDSAVAIESAFNHWDDIELHIKNAVIRSGGHGFVGIGRKRLLNILQSRCEALGVILQFEQEVRSDLDFPDADLIVACDGINSAIRQRYETQFKPDIVTRPNRYIWLGLKQRFDAFTFWFEKTEHGWFQAHVYQFDADTSTCIVECPESVWIAHELDRADPEQSIEFCEKLFSKHLGQTKLMSNARHLRGSAWLNFQRITCEQWHIHNGHCPVVLMGDAVHTAHFAIGSGTKLAIEDAIGLARLLDQDPSSSNLTNLLDRYQAERRIDVLRLQNAAWNAMEWFEVCGERYCDQLKPEQFMYSMLTRSQRIGHENLRLRDKQWLENYEHWFEKKNSGLDDALSSNTQPCPPMFTPFKIRGVTLKNRIVVSPMAQYSAKDGIVGDYHLAHLGARAMGGAALVMAEMTCTSPDARITPACPGLWNDQQAAAWSRIVNFVHQQSDAKIGVQLGHAGAKGSTKLAWEGIDQPLEQDNWPLHSASVQQYLDGVSQHSIALTRSQMNRIADEFVAATERAAGAGFDWLELHCAHGYLLSSFISPLTNLRDDEFGGSLENRLRYPLEIFQRMRAVWPSALPMSVRISAHDWTVGGTTPADAVLIAKAFKAAGADMIDCSSGQVSKQERPVYGRMFQTPFADKIRQEAQIPTIAVGAISEADHVNSIIAAGRADLCAIARPHLANPAWTLTEAARIGYQNFDWPKQYRSAKTQLEANFARQTRG